jgi:hypothetical protein
MRVENIKYNYFNIYFKIFGPKMNEESKELAILRSSKFYDVFGDGVKWVS